MSEVYDWADEAARDLAGSSLPFERRVEIAKELRRAFARGAQWAIEGAERHSCVSSCCDAQPGGATTKELGRCLRAALLRKREGRESETR